MKTGIEIISEERQRQISVEGWTSEHDDTHSKNQLAEAAICYTIHAISGGGDGLWPWDKTWWKPSSNPIKDLTKAGALIAAEIDRLQRKNE